MKAHDDLTFNVIGATMAHDDLTFNVIGATMESPSQNPLLAYINQEFVAIKWNCSDRTPVASDYLSLDKGLGWQTAGSPFLRTPRLCWGKFHCLSLSAECPPQRRVILSSDSSRYPLWEKGNTQLQTLPGIHYGRKHYSTATHSSHPVPPTWGERAEKHSWRLQPRGTGSPKYWVRPAHRIHRLFLFPENSWPHY